MTRALTPLATSITRTTLRRSLGLLSLATFVGLAACGGSDDSSSSGGANGGGGGSGSGDIVFTGTNNSARTGFTPPTDATTCLANKAAFIQVNCLKVGTPAGTTDDLMITFVAPATVGSVANLASGGANTVEFLTTELAGTTTVTKFWGAEAKGTVTITAIDAKSVTFKLAGISLKADTLNGGSASTGTILADGSVTVNLK